MTRYRYSVLMLLLAGTALAADDPFRTAVAPFLQQHCSSCHGARKQEGGVRFDKADGVTADTRHLWTLAHDRLSAGDMPPKDRDRPAAADTKRVLSILTDQQRALGVGSGRRLNRRELAAALADVTGLRVNFANALPADGTVAGFDTGAEGLHEVSDAVALWLAVTRRAVDGIHFIAEPKRQAVEVEFSAVKDLKKQQEAWKAEGIGGKLQGVHRPGVGLLLEPRSAGDREESTVSVQVGERRGVFRVTLTVAVLKPYEKLPNPRLWVRIGGQDVAFPEITGTAEKPQTLVYDVHLGDLAVQAKGVTLSLANKVEIPYAVDGFPNEDKSGEKDPPPGGTGLFRPQFDRKALPPEKQPAPYVVLKRLSIETDVVSAWPPADWKAGITVTDDVGSAAKLLALWTDRAWRRPSTDAERTPFVKLYEKQRTGGATFDDALRAAFQAVLVSPNFRYVPSPAHADKGVGRYALASRLSFMLTGGPPDAELRALADSGKLTDSKVLDAQVDRLLDSPKADAFVRPFVTQWLVMDQPITIAQTHIQKQDFRFARYLKASMREETVAYLARLIADNRPAAEIVASDWTMMNDALALLYGYPTVEGGTLRKVKLRAEDPRGGGVLGHAGIQSMLCWMGDNWVIYRGAWTLRHILDKPPPPPPLEVPELNPAEGKNQGKPFRELLVQHQNDARCSVCHKDMDPVGFAFQNFDLSGRWRDVEHERYSRGELDGRIAWAGIGKTRPVDAAGRLPRGEEFKTFAEFKQLLVKNYRDDLVRGVLKNLVVYGTGRRPGIDDTATLAGVMAEYRPKGYPLRELIKAVVRSPAFADSPPN